MLQEWVQYRRDVERTFAEDSGIILKSKRRCVLPTHSEDEETTSGEPNKYKSQHFSASHFADSSKLTLNIAAVRFCSNSNCKLPAARADSSSSRPLRAIKAISSHWCDYVLIPIKLYFLKKKKVFLPFIHLSSTSLRGLSSLCCLLFVPSTNQQTRFRTEECTGCFFQHISNNEQFPKALIFLLNKKRCGPLWWRNTDSNKLIYRIIIIIIFLMKWKSKAETESDVKSYLVPNWIKSDIQLN